MKCPSYLTLSRHNIYYFRFPLPPNLHPNGRTSDVRLSLQTRCPQEALRLARALFTFGDEALNKLASTRMNYQALRDTLTDHFKALLERHKERLAKDGPLSGEQRANLNVAAETAEELILGNYDIWGMDTENHIAELMEKFSVSFQPETPEYEKFCKAYGQAWRDYCKAALTYDEKINSFDYSDPAPNRKPVSKPVKKLADTIEIYLEEKQRLGSWREKTSVSSKAQLDLLVEYLGSDASLHMSSDAANDVKRMLITIPKYARSKARFKAMSIPELIELEGVPRMDVTSIAKYLQTYRAFYDWAVKRKDTDENNFKELTEKTRKNEQVRDAFRLRGFAFLIR